MTSAPHELPVGTRNAEKQRQRAEGSIPVTRTGAAMTRVLELLVANGGVCDNRQRVTDYEVKTIAY
jgi:hypothetical protein